MSRIEKVVKEVSDLRDFYLKIRRRKQPDSSVYAQKSLDAGSPVMKAEETSQKKKCN